MSGGPEVERERERERERARGRERERERERGEAKKETRGGKMNKGKERALYTHNCT